MLIHHDSEIFLRRPGQSLFSKSTLERISLSVEKDNNDKVSWLLFKINNNDRDILEKLNLADVIGCTYLENETGN